MSYWNHFGQHKYKQIPFSEIKINELFRRDCFNGKRRRKDIIMVKTDEFSYMEVKSKKQKSVARNDFMVSHYSEINIDPKH